LRKGLLLVAVLLAVSCLLAATAYTNAEVSNSATVKVVSTDTALLALEPNEGTGLNDETCYIDERGRLVFNFAAGLDGDYGFQPDSSYEFEDLFIVTNNSNDCVAFGIDVQGDIADFSDWYISNAEGNEGDLYPDNNEYVLSPGQSVYVSVLFDVQEVAADDWTGTVIVKARAVSPE